jgi:hypothetical protein
METVNSDEKLPEKYNICHQRQEHRACAYE